MGRRAGYKQRVALVFPRDHNARVDSNAVAQLLYYANVNTDKLPRIAACLEKRVRNELNKKHYNQANNGAYTFNALVKSCHRDLRCVAKVQKFLFSVFVSELNLN